MNNICFISFKFLDMSIGGWILTFFISCFSAYVMLLFTTKKEKENYRHNRNEKLVELKNNIYQTNDWGIKIKENINNSNCSNPLDTSDTPSSKELLLVASQLKELTEEHSVINQIINEIIIIESYCMNKGYLNNKIQKEELLDHLDELSRLVNVLKKTPINIQEKDVKNEKIEMRIEDLDSLMSQVKEKK